MEKNFLKSLKSYTDNKGVPGKSLKNDHIQIMDQMCIFLDDKYKYKINEVEMVKGMQAKGFNLGSGAIRRYQSMIKNAYDYLIADEADQKIKSETADNSAYKKFSMFGVRCLIKEGISTWEQVETILKENPHQAEISTEEKPSSLSDSKKDSVPTESKLTPEYLRNGQVMKDLNDEIAKESQRYSLIILNKIQGCIAKIHNTLNTENVKLKMKLIEHLTAITSLQNQLKLTEVERDRLRYHSKETAERLDVASEQISQLKEELAGLQNEPLTKELLATLKELKKDLKSEKKEIACPGIQKQIRKPVMIYEKKNNGLEDLPKTYVAIGTKPEFTEHFLKTLATLTKGNPKLADFCINRMNEICEKGEADSSLRNISFTIKTMKWDTPHTPANALCARIKRRYRLTFTITDGQIVFYDIFSKTEAPNKNKQR